MIGHATRATCACGQVAVELRGRSIYCAACHCEDCQRAADQLARLPTPDPVTDPYAGTHYLLHRRDRYTVERGALVPHRLRAGSPTRRMVAECCNTPVFVAFDNAQHWISVYRARVDPAPALQARIATKFHPGRAPLPDDVPAYRTFPLALVAQLLLSRARMAVGR